MSLTEEQFRVNLRTILAQSGLSRRSLSAAFGRDPGYIAALLDPSRPSRARPSPADLARAADVTGIPLVTLLELIWDIDPARLARELAVLRPGAQVVDQGADLTAADRASLADYAAFLLARRRSGSPRQP